MRNGDGADHDSGARLDAARARRAAQREKLALLVQVWRRLVREGAPDSPSPELIRVLDRETMALEELDGVVKQLEAECYGTSAD